MLKKYSPAFAVGFFLSLVSCSSPRYTYNFDHYDYNSGRKEIQNDLSVEPRLENSTGLLKIERNNLVAAADPDLIKTSNNSSMNGASLETPAKTVKELTGAERKQFRKELKDYIKNHSRELKSGDEVTSVKATKQLDDELKLAIIFGAIGITFAILGGINTVFWVIGVIGLIVGLVFFIRWISTQ